MHFLMLFVLLQKVLVILVLYKAFTNARLSGGSILLLGLFPVLVILLVLET